MICAKCKRGSSTLSWVSDPVDGDVRCVHCDKMTPFTGVKAAAGVPKTSFITERTFAFGRAAVLCTKCCNEWEDDASDSQALIDFLTSRSELHVGADSARDSAEFCIRAMGRLRLRFDSWLRTPVDSTFDEKSTLPGASVG